jgi:hypothetical protein
MENRESLACVVVALGYFAVSRLSTLIVEFRSFVQVQCIVHTIARLSLMIASNICPCCESHESLFTVIGIIYLELRFFIVLASDELEQHKKNVKNLFCKKKDLSCFRQLPPGLLQE